MWGASGCFERPSMPWHAWHAIALARPARASAASAGAVMRRAAARATDPNSRFSIRSSAPALVGDAVDGAGGVVRDEQRAVRQGGEVHRPPEILAVLRQPAFGEDLSLV